MATTNWIEPIDIILLINTHDHKSWNHFLTKCLRSHDVKKLERTYIGLQKGMNNLVKEKLNTEKVNGLFVRLTRSIEKTLKDIYRAKMPHPYDNPIVAGEAKKTNEEEFKSYSAIKKKRDQEFEAFLRRVSF